MLVNMYKRFRKLTGALTGVMVFVFALSVILAACKSDNGLPVEDEETGSAAVQRRLDNEQLVALAVSRVFDSKGVSAGSSSSGMKKAASFSITKLNEDEKISYIKYDFDFLQIDDAIRFVAKEIDFPFLNEICGEGEIEVFLTSFSTYLYADETRDINHLNLYIKDDLIVFRGDLGLYSCMSNGGSFSSGMNSLIEYSSHKRFGDNSIEKDLTPPFYQFFIKTENGGTPSLAFSISDNFGAPPVQSLNWTALEGGDIFGSNELFTPAELYDMPQVSQQCTITDVSNGYFLVSSQFNLEKLYFDEHTLFFKGDQPATSEDFVIGDVISVTFNQPYKKYNPKDVLANIIKK